MNEIFLTLALLSVLIISGFTIYKTIKLLERYKERFIGYLLFYLVFQLLFGFFAYIVPHIVKSFILDKTNLSAGSEQVLQIFPFMSVPLALVGTYLFYLIFTELNNKKPSVIFSFFYFFLSGGLYFLNTLVVFRIPFLKFDNIKYISKIFDIGYFSTDIAIAIPTIVSILIFIKKLNYSPKKKMLTNFSLIYLCLKSLKLLFFILSLYFPKSLVFYISLIIGGELFPVLYLNVVLSDVIGTSSEAKGNSLRLESLSNREKEIADLICHGKTNKEIADALFISIQTVKTHTYRIYQKLGIKNRVQLTNILSNI